jgi:drug/metabolite transporter (DMT)-like permease
MAALLALLSALTYGVGDFFGGLSARRIPARAVVLRAHVAGLVGLIAVLPLVTATDVTLADLAIGAGAGTAGGTGVLLFYRSMATGSMSVVAPITSVLAALVPVVVGMAGGERPAALALAGIPVALIAVVLLAREPRTPDRPGTATGPGATRDTGGGLADLASGQVATALAAGLAFGVYFVGLDLTGDGAGLWPVVAGRATSVTMFALVALASPVARSATAGAWRGSILAMVVACGLLDAWANALFLLATQQGMLTLVAVIGALYPASTLLLARAVLGERLARAQLGGVALALGAIVLVTAG